MTSREDGENSGDGNGDQQRRWRRPAVTADETRRDDVVGQQRQRWGQQRIWWRPAETEVGQQIRYGRPAETTIEISGNWKLSGHHSRKT